MRPGERDARVAAVYDICGLRIDAAVVRELIHAVEPMAIERHCRRNGGTWKANLNNSAFLNWSMQQARYEPRLPSGATLPATRITA